MTADRAVLILICGLLVSITTSLFEHHDTQVARDQRDAALAVAEKEVAFNRDCMRSLDRAIDLKSPALTHLRTGLLTCTCEGQPGVLTQWNFLGDGGPPEAATCRCAP